MIFEGFLTVYDLRNIAQQGLMPKEVLVEVCDAYFGDRTIGVTRQYAALGADRRIDRLVRIWEDNRVTTGQYVIINGAQYRIDMLQGLHDDDGLSVMDLTLIRLEDNYDVLESMPEEGEDDDAAE